MVNRYLLVLLMCSHWNPSRLAALSGYSLPARLEGGGCLPSAAQQPHHMQGWQHRAVHHTLEGVYGCTRTALFEHDIALPAILAFSIKKWKYTLSHRATNMAVIRCVYISMKECKNSCRLFNTTCFTFTFCCTIDEVMCALWYRTIHDLIFLGGGLCGMMRAEVDCLRGFTRESMVPCC